MKKAFSIWLLCVMLLQGTGNCWIVAAFYINRNYIATTLCVNRFDLIPVCKGSCFLDLRIKENDKRQEHLPEAKCREILLFCQFTSLTATPAPVLPEQAAAGGYRSPYRSALFISYIFKPPAVCT